MVPCYCFQMALEKVVDHYGILPVVNCLLQHTVRAFVFASQWDYYSQDSCECVSYKSPEALRLIEAISYIYLKCSLLKYLNISERN